MTDPQKTAAQLDDLDRNSPLYIGDFLLELEAEIGDEFAQYVPDGLHERWMKYRSVAIRFPKHRRKPGLSYSHYKLLVSLEADQQNELIDTAHNEQLSVAELRKRLPDYKPRKKRVSYKEKYERLSEAVDLAIEHIETVSSETLKQMLLDGLRERTEGL